MFSCENKLMNIVSITLSCTCDSVLHLVEVGLGHYHFAAVFLEVRVAYSPRDGQLPHHTLHEHEAARVHDTRGLVRPHGFMVRAQANGPPFAAQYAARVAHVGDGDRPHPVEQCGHHRAARAATFYRRLQTSK